MQNRINKAVEKPATTDGALMRAGRSRAYKAGSHDCSAWGRPCCSLMSSCGGLCGGFFQLNFVILQMRLKRSSAESGHDDVDISRLANPGKIKDANLAMVDRYDDFLRSFNDCGLGLCLVIIRHGDRLFGDPAARR